MKIFNKYTLHTAPPPSSGIILSYILKLVEGILPAPSELLNTQRITEAMKYGYGARTKLGDPKFVDVSEVGFQMNVWLIEILRLFKSISFSTRP